MVYPLYEYYRFIIVSIDYSVAGCRICDWNTANSSCNIIGLIANILLNLKSISSKNYHFSLLKCFYFPVRVNWVLLVELVGRLAKSLCGSFSNFYRHYSVPKAAGPCTWPLNRHKLLCMDYPTVSYTYVLFAWNFIPKLVWYALCSHELYNTSVLFIMLFIILSNHPNFTLLI